jgi:hypothetical protein
VFAQDSFDRQLANGWGSAEIGGTYSSASRGFDAFSVDSGSALVRAGVDGSGWAWLGTESMRDVDVTVELTVPEPASGTVSAGPIVRVNDDGMYSVRLVSSGETAGLVVDLIEAGSDTDTRLLGPVALPVDLAEGGPVMVRVQAAGSDPTSLRARAWPAGDPEPTRWHVQLVDWAGRLQHAAGVGLSWAVTRAPAGGIDIEFDDLLALAIDPEQVQ